MAFALVAGVAVFAGLSATTSVVGAATAKPWVIGNIGTYSGDNSTNFANGGLALKAWADYTNAHGGINGHKVDVIVDDDANSPSTALNDVKQMVNVDHVLAIVAMNSGVEADIAPWLTANNIPVIGGSTPLTDFFMKKNFFPVGTTSNNSVFDLLSYAKYVLHQTVGGYLYCSEVPICAALQPVYAGAYTATGGSLAVSQSFDIGAASYNSQCLAAQSAKVQDLEIVGPSPDVVQIDNNCQSLGYNPTLLLNDVVLTPALATELGGADSVFESDAFPFTDTSSPASKTFHAALKKYEPAVLNNSTFTQDDAASWASGELFEAAAKAAKLGNNPTRAQLEAGLYKLKGTTLGGLTPPLTFTKTATGGVYNSIKCIFILEVVNHAVVEPQGLKPYCPPAS